MFIAWQYPISSLTQLYAVNTRRNRPIPSSDWNPGYSGRLRLRSFSISSIARDSRPENLSRVSAYSRGFCSRMYNEPDVSSHISPRSRFGNPTRISFWKSSCRIRVAFRPFSTGVSAHDHIRQALLTDLGDSFPIISSWCGPVASLDPQDT